MLNTFRLVAVLEGISYVLLLGVAMPLKYMAGFHEAVTVTGWIHGGLFVLYLLLLIGVWIVERWNFESVIMAGIASVIPFAPFFLDRKIKKDAEFGRKDAVS